MCIILIGSITFNQHKDALMQNGDGFSVFTKTRGVIKAPDEETVLDIIRSGEFAIWHYRIGTSGEMKGAFNVHPFRICDSKYLLYHNGVIGTGLGQYSDTHALAETLQRVPLTTARSVISALSLTNRFVIASATDPTKFELFGNWTADAGVIMSHKLEHLEYSYKGGRYYGR